jgi:CDP-glucose 4,6-dehydratase
LEPLGGYLLLASKLWTAGKEFSGGWNFGPVETNHATVRELIESIIRITGKGAYEVPPAEKNMHEARLLKLDISRANALLNWKPVLNYEETIEFTGNGYIQQSGNGKNIYHERAGQLIKYLYLSESKGIRCLLPK